MLKNILQFSFFTLFVASMVADYGCSNATLENLSEGKIVYDVTYPDGQEFTGAELPTELTLYFRDDKTCMEFNSSNGNSNTRMIADSNAQIYSTLVDAMGRKIAMTLGKEEVKNNYRDRVPLKISFTENTKQIAGVKCKEAVCMDSTNNFYSVYYSDDFKIKEPNWSSAFNEIPGVLMEYDVQINNVVMSLKAKTISSEKIDPSKFIIPRDYKMISPVRNT